MEMNTKCVVELPEDKNQVEDLGLCGKIILKYDLRN
jgi:hypothetical protein